MFTKNWYKAIASQMSNASASIKTSVNYAGATNFQSGYGNGGAWLNLLNTGDAYVPSMKVLRQAATTAGTILGTGTTPPTIDDYCLSGDIVTGYAYNYSTSYSADDTGIEITAVYTITNNNAEDITIGEIGLLAGAGTGAGKTVLMERTVLDTPVTIPAGGVGQITYTIKMVYPTD